MILCGGKGERLYPLTRDRAKPSVPFLGAYRIIDFSLSNSLNSGLRKIALLTQYKSLSLERHILHGWNIFHPESKGYIISLPAQGRVSEHWYEGTADAVFQNIYSIQQENPDAVLVLSGDHVYKADYRRILQFYREKDADAVILAKTVDRQEASRFGVVEIDESFRIVSFLEKPKNPPALPTSTEHSLVSMGVYLFKTTHLIRMLIKDAKNPRSTHDFGKDVLPQIVKDHRVFAYPFQGYWEDIGTIDAYWKANMSFLSIAPPFILDDSSWPIRTYKAQYPPSFIEKSNLQNSIISGGCVIRGGTLSHSVLSPGVKVGEGSQVRNSIIFEGVQLGRNVKLQKVIIDKFSRIPDDFTIGLDEDADKKNFKTYGERIRIVPRGWRAG
jgi:glucose-1-phosphate adenylyltransferase